MWQALNGTHQFDRDTSGIITDTSYTLEGLEDTTVYNITVTAHSEVFDNTISQPVIAFTGMNLK